MQVYPAKYIDKNGEYKTTIRNDGKILQMNVRAVEFYGNSFDDFESKEKLTEDKMKLFSFDKFNCLCDCTIKCEIPIQIISSQFVIEANLLMKLVLGKANQKGWMDKENLSLKLKYGEEFQSKGKSGWFEDELLDIEKQLPDEHKLKNCFGCAFSDYSVYGHGFFGDMLCFRNIKDEYKKVFDKQAFMKIMDKAERTVQETYLCPEFEVRKAGTGYRG